MKPGENVGILLVNTGTAAAPRPRETRAFLAEFLADRRVMDMPRLARWLLLHLVSLRTRPGRSARACAQVWTDEGAPLLVHTRRLGEALGKRLPHAAVEIGMRYGAPSIADGLEALVARQVGRIIVAPLFPQYASAATGTVLEHAYAAAGARWHVPPLSVLPPFFGEAAFLDAWAALAAPVLERFQPDHVLMTYHGLPERHIRKGDPTGTHCLVRPDCCDTLGPQNRNCYRAQCMATSRGLAARLGLDNERHTTAFQSRLGRAPWLKPSVDGILDELPRRGVKRLVVLCPGFVADCLETLGEIGIRARERFLKAGGREFHAAPCLNSHPAWVEGLAALLEPL